MDKRLHISNAIFDRCIFSRDNVFSPDVTGWLFLANSTNSSKTELLVLHFLHTCFGDLAYISRSLALERWILKLYFHDKLLFNRVQTCMFHVPRNQAFVYLSRENLSQTPMKRYSFEFVHSNLLDVLFMYNKSNSSLTSFFCCGVSKMMQCLAPNWWFLGNARRIIFCNIQLICAYHLDLIAHTGHQFAGPIVSDVPTGRHVVLSPSVWKPARLSMRTKLG